MKRNDLIEARRLPEARRLRLTWSDGATAEPTYDLLQGYCPCAGCRGHAAGEIVFLPPKKPITALDLAPVGNYGLALVFEGGCSAGIYAFDFLREVCAKENLLVQAS